MLRIIVFKLFSCLLLLSAITIVNGQTSDTTFYPNGRIERIESHLPNDITKYISFDNKGRLTDISRQGYFNACGISVGTDTIFYPSGKIKKEIFYDNRESKTETGCHAIWTTQVHTEYHPNEKIKSKKSYEYCYECDVCRCGIWKFYNTKGKIIKQQTFGNCYDQN
ncbi:MAG: hypothetical protein IPJ81_02525 [Chitinophagaceae bacterium]|nr:hypothetical protein [Chitinophagaceae bacterium]